MANYTDYNIKCYINVFDDKYKGIVKTIDWLCNGQSRGQPEPEHGLKNPFWNRIGWGCEKIYFNKHTGALILVSSDGVKANPLPEFIEYIRPAITGSLDSLNLNIGWYKCESNNIIHHIVL